MAGPFTYTGYRELIRDFLLAGYRFVDASEFMRHTTLESGPVVFMRHDIDFDIDAANAIAEIESEEGIQATYFFLLRTDHYNLFSKEGSGRVQAILSRGHHLGLHFDCAAYPDSSGVQDLAAASRKEAELLGNWFGNRVDVVSYHRPNALVLSGDPALSEPLPHTYTPQFIRDKKYCSDSCGEWRYGEPRTSPEFAERKSMHILIHPIWWSSERLTPNQTFSRWLSGRIGALDESAAANCKVYQRRGLADRIEA
jgi:hypothetical protein